VIEARAYARAKAQHDAATTSEARQSLPRSPLRDLVDVITFELVQEALDAPGGSIGD
jgi:hypothetical protein